MSAYYFIFCKDELMLTLGDEIPLCEVLPIKLPEGRTLHRLPLLDGTPCFTAAIDVAPSAKCWQMMPLRASFDVLPSVLYAMAGKAREILHWDAQTQYCSVCGTPMLLHTDISKRCPNCGRLAWPALSTAIIVAVTRNNGQEILLVQSKNFKKDYLGLVAGFVETGETLEECLCREVMEETGIRVKNIRYFGSQPWPYPSGLMVGYFAEYDGGEIRLQRSELNKGGWYSRDHMPAIPGKVSLARRIIDAWLESK